MFAPTFSRLDVALGPNGAARCVFPWTGRLKWPRRPERLAATLGTSVSRAAECLAVFGQAPVDELAAELADADRRSFLAMVGHLAELLAEEAETDLWRRAEVALAYDCASGRGRELSAEQARDYSGRAWRELSGTPDLVRVRADGVLVVRDYKTGRYKWGAKAGDQPQLRALGLAAARAYRHDQVVVELVQVDEDGLRRSEDLLDPFELDCAAGELRGLLDRIERAQETPRPGHWCAGAYCPTLATCPATLKLMEAIAGASGLQHPITAELTSPEHAAYVLERLAAAEMAIETIRHAVQEMARKAPIPLANGKLYGPVVQDGRETIDLSVKGAVALVEEHLGPFAAATAIEKRTSKTALETAAKAEQARRGEGVKKFRALLEALDELGAVRHGAPFEKFTEFSPKAAEVPSADEDAA